MEDAVRLLQIRMLIYRVRRAGHSDGHSSRSARSLFRHEIGIGVIADSCGLQMEENQGARSGSKYMLIDSGVHYSIITQALVLEVDLFTRSKFPMCLMLCSAMPEHHYVEAVVEDCDQDSYRRSTGDRP